MDIESLKVRILSVIKPVIESIVDFPDDVVMESQSSATSILVSVIVHPDDLGKAIGRQGKNAMAVRAIVNAMCGKYHFRSSVEVVSSGSDHSGTSGVDGWRF